MMIVDERLHTTVQRRKTSIWLVALTALVAATLPVLIGVVLLISLVTERPLLTRPSKLWWNPLADRLNAMSDTLVRRVTAWWGIAFLLVGALQGSAELAGLSITNPIDALVRSLGALVLEAAVVAGTVGYLSWRAR